MAKTKLDRQVDIKEHKTSLDSHDNSFSSMKPTNTGSAQEVNDSFWQLWHEIQNITTNFQLLWNNMQFRNEMDELLTLASLSIDSYYNKYKLFLEALSLGSKSAPNTPILLPPESFLSEHTFIQNQISGKYLALPMPVSRETLAAAYRKSAGHFLQYNIQYNTIQCTVTV